MPYRTNSDSKMVPMQATITNLPTKGMETRVQFGGYIADIVPDDVKNPSIHHCIVQRVGSPNVLYLGQERSFAAALASGFRHVEELAGPRPKKTAVIYEFKPPEPK